MLKIQRINLNKPMTTITASNQGTAAEAKIRMKTVQIKARSGKSSRILKDNRRKKEKKNLANLFFTCAKEVYVRIKLLQHSQKCEEQAPKMRLTGEHGSNFRR